MAFSGQIPIIRNESPPLYLIHLVVSYFVNSDRLVVYRPLVVLWVEHCVRCVGAKVAHLREKMYRQSETMAFKFKI